MTPDGTFRCEIETSDSDDGHKVTAVRCHGRLTVGNSDQLKDAVEPLISAGGHIVVDLGELKYLDSAGLGTLLSLKTSSLRHGSCRFELANVTQRILDLLRLTHTDTILLS